MDVLQQRSSQAGGDTGQMKCTCWRQVSLAIRSISQVWTTRPTGTHSSWDPGEPGCPHPGKQEAEKTWGASCPSRQGNMLWG